MNNVHLYNYINLCLYLHIFKNMFMLHINRKTPRANELLMEARIKKGSSLLYYALNSYTDYYFLESAFKKIRSSISTPT